MLLLLLWRRRPGQRRPCERHVQRRAHVHVHVRRRWVQTGRARAPARRISVCGVGLKAAGPRARTRAASLCWQRAGVLWACPLRLPGVALRAALRSRPAASTRINTGVSTGVPFRLAGDRYKTTHLRIGSRAIWSSPFTFSSRRPRFRLRDTKFLGTTARDDSLCAATSSGRTTNVTAGGIRAPTRNASAYVMIGGTLD